MRLRFTIRDLLWLTVVVALAVGWCIEHQNFIRRDEPMAQVYTLKFSDPRDTRDVLRSIYADKRDMEFAVDLDHNCIVVLARPSMQVEIRILIEQIDRPDNRPTPAPRN